MDRDKGLSAWGNGYMGGPLTLRHFHIERGENRMAFALGNTKSSNCLRAGGIKDGKFRMARQKAGKGYFRNELGFSFEAAALRVESGRINSL
jgi:hypothetical protein